MQVFWILMMNFILTGLPGRFELIYSGEAPSNEFYTDHLENIYFVDDHNIIKIQAPTGRRLEYGSISGGTITFADVTNPLQIMIFYGDFNRIQFLDNRLSPLRSEINMSDLNIDKTILACSSGKGGFWVFSDYDDQLVYFDPLLRRSHHSMILRSITGTNIRPVFMTEFQNLLYMHVPGHGILVFDRFASYLRTVSYNGPSNFRIRGGNIIYFDRGELSAMNIDTGETRLISMPPDLHPDSADLQAERIYILSGGRIYSYSNR
jgi:hypothetical protein